MKKICSALLFLLIPQLRAHAKLDDLDVVKFTILGEARGEGRLGMQAVANVIQNRAIAQGKSCREICLAKKQFSFWNGGVRQSTLTKLGFCKQEHYAWELAHKLVKGIKLTDVTGKANHYHALSCKPTWADDRLRTCEIHNHRFYKI